MKEIKDIIIAFDEAHKKGIQTSLATVVHVKGSSYRKPGARMLITEHGELTGAISGGCLEGDALRKAFLVMQQQKPLLVTYDTTDEDDAKLGMGLGCDGIIQVLIEPVNPSDPDNPIVFLKSISEDRQKAILVTLFSIENKKDIQYGTCILIKENGKIINTAPLLKKVLIEDAKKALASQTTSFKNYISESHNITAFIEVIKPAVSLIVIGAGNDAIPLLKMADILGWETTVVDGRPNYAKQERFTKACRIIVSKPENVLEQLTIDEQTVFVLMTHNYNYDLAMFRKLIQSNVVYLGMLGPRKRLNRMVDELKEEGTKLTPEQLFVIHNPVGLDIGGETSEEIALAILAEIKAVIAGRNGLSLKNKKEVMHDRSGYDIEKIQVNEPEKNDYK